MPTYYNPYANINPGMWQAPVSSMPQMPMQQVPRTMEWVTGKAGAQAYPMPNGFPPNQWLPLWDDQDTMIYLKSWNQMGAANPLYEIRYSVAETPMNVLPESRSGDSGPDMSQYVTKDDFEQLRNEIRKLNQNGSRNGNNSGNRGENR